MPSSPIRLVSVVLMWHFLPNSTRTNRRLTYAVNKNSSYGKRNKVVKFLRYRDICFLRRVLESWTGICRVYSKEADVICLQDLDKIIRDVLREKYWCKLISPNLQVHFGYDYCMYVVSFINSINLKDFQYDAIAITIKNYISPYLNCWFV